MLVPQSLVLRRCLGSWSSENLRIQKDWNLNYYRSSDCFFGNLHDHDRWVPPLNDCPCAEAPRLSGVSRGITRGKKFTVLFILGCQCLIGSVQYNRGLNRCGPTVAWVSVEAPVHMAKENVHHSLYLTLDSNSTLITPFPTTVSNAFLSHCRQLAIVHLVRIMPKTSEWKGVMSDMKQGQQFKGLAT